VIGIHAVGVVSALGDTPEELVRRLDAGETALAPSAELRHLPDPRAGVVPGPDLGPWLARRKDARLLPRAARLALPAAGRALAGLALDRDALGLFVAVGREPPDEGEAEPALAALASPEGIDLSALAGAGRALYPPLLPLRTLPNMVLAWVSIQCGIRGENGTWAGGPEAAAAALAEGVRAVEEGRCPAALVGAAWSGVDLGSARDRVREGATDPPGEAAVFVVLAPGGVPIPPARAPARAALGDLGPVEGLLHALRAVVPSPARIP